MHVSSLASRGSIGDLGPAAYAFVEFLAAAKQHVWQVLPLSPTGYGNSPYASSSAFAGNPFLISVDKLVEWGWIGAERAAGVKDSPGRVDFEDVERGKLPLLMEAAGNFLDRGASDERLKAQWAAFEQFSRDEHAWLDDYAFYAVLRRKFNTGAWTEWPEAVRRREPAALLEVAEQQGRELAQEQALQFAFAVQWGELRAAAAQKGIRILGDVAIFVNMDSADVWVHPSIFDLDENLKPVRVAGVPPDYFSATGQRWGNPLYRWDVLEIREFDWWVSRIRRACQLYDIVRLDHFRGFEAYWSIPAEEETAVKGEWVTAPGLKLFQALEAALGPLPLVAEDLGIITPEVDALRLELGLPGMKVIQFGFSDKSAHMHLPHEYTPGTVAYTGTHDNETTLGWWNSAPTGEKTSARAYLGPGMDTEPHWTLINALSMSVANTLVIPFQDVLGLDTRHRMNTPGMATGCWEWRFEWSQVDHSPAERLAAMTRAHGRWRQE